ncbi:putative phospholipid ABC transporter-binding protein MlaD [Pseudoruegeria aquimaris]|uniref:Putative phospholipid ABC transporter-binding protein MlaD n=1 Tax=Pseudoruegeria aquimaris TaxID=393663 RepID=A0A1Y5RCU4_9RHOB|nr:outer membrane lipid asymmetry maintenance protein MlaD [Pseudoruegeria aquimaris]SLN14487.1 putative phospholipid ABC transporter-binding protein MlaD [Pseudoruegeria aquimaris]
MAENLTETLVGAGVVAVAAGFLLYTSQVTGLGSGGGGGAYPLKASFRSVEGVTVGTDVRLAGVKIGTVTALTLNPETFRADATLTLQDGIEIPDDSAAVIASEGLLGGNFVEVVPGGSPFAFAPGDEVLDTQGAVSLVSLLLKFVTGDGQ